MTSKIISFQVYRGSTEGRIVQDTTNRVLGRKDALVKLAHSGVCGTDAHFLRSGCVLGHEGVGYVEEVGEGVQGLVKGDRVGFGYVHKVCGKCDYCLNGMEQFCADAQLFGNADLDEGSFGTHAVWDADMLVKIPSTLNLKDAAPLMCAGATVWTALTMYGLKPGDRVGIQGVGGLGHLAIQFAAKLGHEVIVLSSSESKREEAFDLGATDFFAMKGSLEYPTEDKSIIFWFVAAETRITQISFEATPIYLHQLVLKGIRVQGSCVAARTSIRRMLRFAALHRIKPVIMEWPMDQEGIEKAMEALRSGSMRYKGVLNA
ncbi:zinc-binding dehydrogenase [Paraphaeosphaeria sporulosa]